MSQQSDSSVQEEALDGAFVSTPPPGKSFAAMGTIEELKNTTDFFDPMQTPAEDFSTFAGATMDEKLNKLMRGISYLINGQHENAKTMARHDFLLSDVTEGVIPKLQTLQIQVDNNTATISQVATKKELKDLKDSTKEARAIMSGLKENKEVVRRKDLESIQNSFDKKIEDMAENKSDAEDLQQLKTQMARMQGVMAKQEKQIIALNNKITNLTTRSMDCNFTIAGWREPNIDATVEEPKQEDCATSVCKFLGAKLQLTVPKADIFQAYRIGAELTDRSRLLFFQCDRRWSLLIKNNAKLLRNNKQVSITQQIPDAALALRGKIGEQLKQVKESNKGKPLRDKTKYMVRQGQVFIDGQLQKDKIVVPFIDELFPMDEEQIMLDSIELKATEPRHEMQSSFVGLAAYATDLTAVQRIYCKARQEYASADHIIMAYVVGDECGAQDDGEHRAGVRMLRLLQEEKVEDTVIMVVRRFGGIHLGTKRFDCIKATAKAAIDLL